MDGFSRTFRGKKNIRENTQIFKCTLLLKSVENSPNLIWRQVQNASWRGVFLSNWKITQPLLAMIANIHVYTASLSKWSKTRSGDITLSLLSLCIPQEPLFEPSFLFNFYSPASHPNVFVLEVLQTLAAAVYFVILTLISVVKFTLHRPHWGSILTFTSWRREQ